MKTSLDHRWMFHKLEARDLLLAMYRDGKDVTVRVARWLRREERLREATRVAKRRGKLRLVTP